jgi:hypothetical protein
MLAVENASAREGCEKKYAYLISAKIETCNRDTGGKRVR